MVIGQVACCGRQTEEKTCWQLDIVYHKTVFPFVTILQIRRYGKNIVLVSDADVRLVVYITEANLTTCKLCVRAIPIMIVAPGAVVHHGTQIGMLVLKDNKQYI